LAVNPETVVLSGLSAGEHHLRIFNDCGEITRKFYIESSNDLSFTVTTNNVKLDCAGKPLAGAYIALDVSGTSTQYWYTYNDGKTWTLFTGTKDTIWNLTQGDYLIEVKDADSCVYQVSHVVIKREVICDLTLELALFLEGVIASDSSMTTHLQGPSAYPGLVPDKALPTCDPYTGMPGSEHLPACYPQINDTLGPVGKVVDWILVEIWTNFETYIDDDIEYTKYDLHEGRALLLKSDGRVVDTNNTPPKFKSYAPDSVRIVIKHRNHLAVISSALLPFVSDQSYNFSDNVAKAIRVIGPYYQPMAVKHGKACLWAGDIWNGRAADGNLYIINVTDITRFINKMVESPPTPVGSYMLEDVNMDGLVDESDGVFINYNGAQNIFSPAYFYRKRP
jgi:hypothetical protein